MALEKLIITAYENPDFTKEVGKFTTSLNPESYSLNHDLQYKEEEKAGSSNPNLVYEKTNSSNLDLKILLDGTGVLKKVDESVADRILIFQKLTYKYNGNTHRPNYIVIAWGTLLFKGVLTKLKVDYKIFKENGEPLRAIINASFKNSEEVNFVVRKENKQSPDLTHIRTVKAGDTLPNMCYNIYGDSSYFIQVARVNKLINFRNLKPGQRLFFPPVEPFSNG